MLVRSFVGPLLGSSWVALFGPSLAPSLVFLWVSSLDPSLECNQSPYKYYQSPYTKCVTELQYLPNILWKKNVFLKFKSENNTPLLRSTI